MKTSALILTLTLTLAAPSCEKYEISRYYRALVMGDNTSADDSLGRDKEFSDTNLFVSAVLVPETYDWRRDTAYGAVNCEVAFFKNNDLVFSADAGPGTALSPNPSTHHIIDGHLYTECVTGDETIISMDGEPLYRYTGTEVLRGLLVRPGEILTLGRQKGGDGFSYRRNGEIIIRQTAGTVFGDFSHPAYGPSGALYEDDGRVCFCFKDSRYCYKVVDGTVTQQRLSVSASTVADMRVIESNLYYIAGYTRATMIFSPQRTMSMPSSMEFSDLKISVADDGSPFLFAETLNPETTIVRPLASAAVDGAGVSFDGNNNFVIGKEGSYYAVSNRGGLLRLLKEGGGDIFVRDSSFFFGRNCVAAKGKTAFLIVNPKEKEFRPFIWHHGEEKEYDISGFLTAMEVSVNPAS